MHSKKNRVFIKIFKIVGWVLISVVLLLATIALLIQIPAIQLKLTQKAISFLEKKIGTKVSLESIYIGFPKEIVLKGIYLEDQQGDTLLYAKKFSIDTDLWALTRNEIQLNDVTLETAVAFVHRSEKDSSFNFSYILEAFAGDSTAVPDTLEQKKWDFSIESISLQKIRLEYQDLLEGNMVNLSLGDFELTMDAFDLRRNTFGVEKIVLTDTRARIQQTKISVAKETTENNDIPDSSALHFSLKEIALSNVYASYEHSALGQQLRLDLGEAKLEAEKIDLNSREINLNGLTLKRTFIAYQQSDAETLALPDKKTLPKNTADLENQTWKISLGTLDLANNSLQYYDFTKPQLNGAIDFDHLWVTNLTIDARDILYSPSEIKGDLRGFSFQEKSGFTVKSFTGRILVTETSAVLNDFLLLTGNSRLQLEAKAGFSSFKNLSANYQQATLSTDIQNSHINVRDILYLNPNLLDSIQLNLPVNSNLRIDASIAGSVNNLKIKHLVFGLLSDTNLRTSGTISGLPEAKKMRMNIALNKFYTTKADMEKVLPDSLLPDSLALPDWLNLQGAFQGTTEVASFNTLLTSSVGTIQANGKMNLDSSSALRGYDAKVAVDQLSIGKILMKPDSVMGKLTMSAELHTNGLSPEEMNGSLTALVNSFEFKGYQYKDLKLKGGIRNNVINGQVTMTDENLDFTLTGGYNYQDKVPAYNIMFDLKNADFKALNLTLRPLKARGTLLVNMATSDFKILNGNIGIRKVAIFNGNDLYAVDSLLFVSIDQEGKSEINIDSDLLAAKFEGSINIFALSEVLHGYFHTYYSLHDSLDIKDVGNQHFSFNIKLKNTDLLTGILIPELKSFVPGEIKGEFDSEAKRLDLSMEINQIQYANIGVKSFKFTAKSDPSALQYNFMADEIKVDSMRVDGLEFKGIVANDSIRTDLIIRDSVDTEKYVLAGTFFSRDQGFELSLLPESIKLNYQKWSVPENNFFRFGGEKMIAQNVELTNVREKIIIESSEKSGSPILIGFRELNLEYLSSMIAQQKPLSGLLNGDINLYPGSTGMTFTSDIRVDNFSISEVPWGDIALAVEQKTKNRFDVDFLMTGKENNMTAKGFYTGGETAAINLILNIDKFNVASLQPLVYSQLENLTGTLSGKMQIGGTPLRPDINGNLKINETQFLSNYLQSSFKIDDETITFNNEGLSFDQFEIKDINQNTARLDGVILTKTYRDFNFKLNLIANQFRLFNTTKEDNGLYYGKADIKANARIRGTMTSPIIDMEIGLSEGSDLTYVVPQSKFAVLETEGIVKFVDKTFEGDPFMKRISKEVIDTVKSAFTGVDLTAKITLSDKTSFTIVIDPITQDQLSIKGNSTLTLKIDPTGDIQLSGRYEISEGSYNLSFYKFVKRKFAIESGSTITWSGDPLNAEMDIRAIFKVETAPIELFSNQLTGSDASEVNQYKQRLPFLVYLNIGGQLLQPKIGFKLEMPMNKRNAFGGNVYARLQDINTRESDLNKQVFALLILKRFIADNPFENQTASGFEGTARSSVSKILAEQLNRLSENVKGVELSFDIKSYEDYSGAKAQGQTKLQLGLSKTLFNDRLVVKLSGNVDIEGQNTNRQATDYIGDLALEYKLTPDGRFRITGFRNSNYDMIDGELTETGAGLIYVKDYNTLGELFKANANSKN